MESLMILNDKHRLIDGNTIKKLSGRLALYVIVRPDDAGRMSL